MIWFADYSVPMSSSNFPDKLSPSDAKSGVLKRKLESTKSVTSQ